MCTFQYKEENLKSLRDKIKLQCFCWLKASHTTFVFDYHYE